MKSREEIFQKVRRIIAEKADLQEEGVTLKSHFRDDLKISSIVIISIVLAVETEFNIEVADEEIVVLATVEDAVRAISDKLSGTQGVAPGNP